MQIPYLINNCQGNNDNISPSGAKPNQHAVQCHNGCNDDVPVVGSRAPIRYIAYYLCLYIQSENAIKSIILTCILKKRRYNSFLWRQLTNRAVALY